MEIILASGSPRRKELLGLCCPDFRVEFWGKHRWTLPAPTGSNRGKRESRPRAGTPDARPEEEKPCRERFPPVPSYSCP